MRFFNLTLTPAEANACSADYLEEKSPRGNVARVLLRIVAVVARISTELEELKRAETSPSLWRLHADSLLALLEVARALPEHAADAMEKSGDESNGAGRDTIKTSLQRLRQRSDASAAALTETGSRVAKV
jgi:hypothetical protein